MLKYLAVLVLIACTAHAQTTQPVYVRPSKGAALTITITIGTPSVVIDVTAFEALQLKAFGETWNVDNLNQFARFTYADVVVGPKHFCKITTQTSPDKTTGFLTAQTENGERLYDNAESACAATTSLIVTPLPFSPHKFVSGPQASGTVLALNPYPTIVGGVNASGASSTVQTVNTETISTADGTKNIQGLATSSSVKRISYTTSIGALFNVVATLPAGTNASSLFGSFGDDIQGAYYTHVQNIGTVPVGCGRTFTSDVTSYLFALKAGTADNDGTGGEKVLNYYPKDLYCFGIGGVGKVVAFVQRGPY